MGNDLSFNIIALDRASEAFDKVAAKLDEFALRLDALDHKNVDIDVNVKTDESQRALDSFQARFNLLATGIVAAAPFIGAGIVAGVGAGFIGVAALAEKSNQDVRDTYTQLWHDVVAVTRNASDQIVPQIVGAGREMDAAMQGLGPSIKTAMSYAEPDVVALTRGVEDLATNAMPGVTSAMSNSLPVVEGVSTALGDLGTTAGNAMASLGEHSQQFGTDLSSLGAITQSVVGLSTNLVDDLGITWSQNADQMDGAVANVSSDLSGLAQGVLPVLSFTLGVAAGAIKDITGALGPMTPLLGAGAAGALALWGAFKLADLATTGVKAVAAGVVALSANIESGAANAAGFMAELQGVDVEASATAGAVTAAGEAAATAGVEIGAATEAIAGPLGLALVGATILLGAFSGGEHSTQQNTQDLTGTLDTLTSAFEQSHGALTESVVTQLQASTGYKDASNAASQFGVSQTQLTIAVTQGGAALGDLRTRLQQAIDAHTRYTATTTAGGKAAGEFSGGVQLSTKSVDAQGQAAQDALNKLNGLVTTYGQAQDKGSQLAQAQQAVAVALVGTSDYQDAAASSATTLGLSLGQVTTGYQSIIATGDAASSSVEDVSAAFLKSSLAVAQAQQSITDHFTQADQAVKQAQQSVADAAHSYQQSATSIADAQHSYVQAQQAVIQADEGVANAHHSVAQAQQSLADAESGVAIAEENDQRAMEKAQQAQVALNAAREKAVEDLKALHLQLADQTASEDNSRVSLFDAQQAASAVGVNGANAQQIATEQVTVANEAQVKAAIALLQAENGVNDTMNTGANLRKQVAQADQAGVNGAQVVIQAQDALTSAQDQVNSSAQALAKAHQQVSNAAYSLQQANLQLVKAQQSVSDASYSEQKAHQAVTDAQYARQRAAQQLQIAQANLTQAQTDDTRILGLNSKAGQDNLGMLLQLYSAIQSTHMPVQQQYNTLVQDMATAFGMSTTSASNYLKQLGLIPQNFQFGVTAVGQVDLSHLPDIGDPGYHHAIGTGYAEGGHFRGAGGPRSDSNLVRVSDGEYIVNAASTAKNLKLLDLINSGPPGFASGGQVSPEIANNVLWGAFGIEYSDASDVLGVMGIPGLNLPALATYVAPAAFGGAGGGLGGSTAANGGIAAEQAYAESIFGRFGWGPEQLPYLIKLWNQESGWNPLIVNKSSGAYGIPQSLPGDKMASAGADWRTNAATQIQWGEGYIHDRYGSPAGAWAHEMSHNWYADGGLVKRPQGFDSGGWLMPNSSGVNGLGRPEAVLTPEESEAFVRTAKGASGPSVTVTNNIMMPTASPGEVGAEIERHLVFAMR